MTAPTVSVSLVAMEGVHLAHLVEEFRELVAESAGTDDPAISRLTPDPYPDDARASQEFADGVRDELLDRRVAESRIVSAALASFEISGDSLTQEQALTEHTVVIPWSDVDAWLRTLNAIRLIIASRLEIETDDDHDPDDPRFGVYDWLGYRLELLIQAADELL